MSSTLQRNELDGGGSTAMWVTDRLVNKPSDGVERRVGNHIAVILQSDYVECESEQPHNEAGIGIAARPQRKGKLQQQENSHFSSERSP